MDRDTGGQGKKTEQERDKAKGRGGPLGEGDSLSPTGPSGTAMQFFGPWCYMCLLLVYVTTGQDRDQGTSKLHSVLVQMQNSNRTQLLKTPW